jgi:hypothetical protein
MAPPGDGIGLLGGLAVFRGPGWPHTLPPLGPALPAMAPWADLGGPGTTTRGLVP